MNDPIQHSNPPVEISQDIEPVAGNGNVDPALSDTNFGPQDDDETHMNIRSTTTRVPSPNERRDFRAFHSQQEKESNKENEPSLSIQGQLRAAARPKKRTIFDSQPDAQRIEFESQPGPSSIPQPPTRKRDRGSSPVSEDEGFEVDTRVPQSSLSNRRIGARAAGKPSPQKRARIAEPPTARTQSLVKRQPTPIIQSPQSSASRQRSTPAEEGLPSRSQSYMEANRRAKEKTQQQVAVRPAQRRRPWSAEEIEHLQALIEEVGTSWSRIKSIDDDLEGNKVFQGRDQGALKDKARNMKFDMLKCVLYVLLAPRLS